MKVKNEKEIDGGYGKNLLNIILFILGLIAAGLLTFIMTCTMAKLFVL